MPAIRQLIPCFLPLRIRMAVAVFGLILTWPSLSPAAQPVEGITFAAESGKVFVPLDEAAKHLGWRTFHDRRRKRVRINWKVISTGSIRSLTTGDLLVSLDDLAAAGAAVHRQPKGILVTNRNGGRHFTVFVGKKRAEIDLGTQRLRAWQGGRLVLESRISSGRGRSTPTGNFTAGPYKAQSHFSSLYDNAPMPWSVQVTGNVFIHGFTSVPDYPASHGCIRLPLDDGNPARFFYEWVDKGTPIRIARK